MGRKYSFTIFLGVVLLAYGCKDSTRNIYAPPVFPEVTDAEFSIISDTVIMPGTFFDMDLYKDNILLLYLMDDKWLHLHSAKTGEKVASGVHYGRGPGEIISSSEFVLNKKTGKVSLFDIQMKKLVTVQIDSLLNGVISIEESSAGFRATSTKIYPIDSGFISFKRFAYKGPPVPKTRYRKHSLDGTELSSYNLYPMDSLAAFLVYTSSKSVISPDQEKMAIGTLYGAILETFDISGEITRTGISRFIEPKYDPKTRTLNYDECGTGFMGIAVTDNMIYASFAGEGNFVARRIAMFDWEGRPVKAIRTNSRIGKICLDEEKGLLYAILWGEDNIPIFAVMDMKEHVDVM